MIRVFVYFCIIKKLILSDKSHPLSDYFKPIFWWNITSGVIFQEGMLIVVHLATFILNKLWTKLYSSQK